jgi:radical SAM protein with 4Fe4S-binding SPASM domain
VTEGLTTTPRLVRYSIPDLDRHLFFNPAYACSVVTNTCGAKMIDDYLSLRGESNPFIEKLSGIPVFQGAEQDKTYGRVPERLIIELTTACNLRCKTCYLAASRSRENELTTDEVRKLLFEAAKSGTRTVAFIGGEPFLRRDLPELVDIALDSFFDVQVSTNGTIVTEGFIERFSGLENLTLQVSLDGPDEVSNDAIRGTGTYARASRFLELAATSGIRTSVSSVLNRVNYNQVGAMCDFAFEKGCTLAIFHKVHVFGRAEEFPEIVPSPAQLRHGMGLLLNKFHEYEVPGKMAVDFPHHRCFRGDSALDAAVLGCHFGRAYAYVTSAGDLVCCSHLQDGEFNYGNVRERGLIEIWQTSPGLDAMRNLTVESIPSCSRCKFKYMCRGSCRADALANSGDIAGDPHDCEALRSFYEYVLDYFAREQPLTIPEKG